MPTIFTHAAVPLALGVGLGSRIVPPKLVIAGAVASMLPDLDVVGFSFGVPWGSALAHRGFSHSIVFAAALGLVGASFHRRWGTSFARAFGFLFVTIGSHGLLDAFTNGGSGIALLWPWTSERYFAPWRVIEVSPLGVARFFSRRGVTVLASELLWVWLPCALGAMTLMLFRLCVWKPSAGSR